MFERITSRVLWLPSITDQPVTVGELLSASCVALSILAAVQVLCKLVAVIAA